MSVLETIDPAARYRVQVARPVAVSAARFLPRDTSEMSGRLLARLIAEHGVDAIRSATIV
jgi:hypothetical protein